MYSLVTQILTAFLSESFALLSATFIAKPVTIFVAIVLQNHSAKAPPITICMLFMCR